MEHYYMPTLAVVTGVILAFVFIGAMVGIYRLVIFLGDTINDWWNDRKRRKTASTPRILWPNSVITPNELRSLQGLSPFHKHHYKLIRARHTLYEFVCRKDGCGETVEIPRTYFWDGGKDTQQLYQEALSAMRNYRIESKYTQASAWRTEDL